MLERFRELQARVLVPVARALLRAGLSPIQVTWFGTISVVAASLICFPQGWLWQGAIITLLLSASDMIDGHMAREAGRVTRWGSFLDSSLDRVADAAIIGGLAWHLGLTGGPWWAAVAVLALVAALLTSYLKARAEAVGATADSGIITRADRVALALVGALLAGLGVPYALEAAMVVLALGGVWTVVQRFAEVHHQLSHG
ncbi:MAG: CDP-alcohol phosphatidyltransferase family protein [Propionibacteriaceae bacterium]|nr:CDP-alcohol phosphatidyltransferase family protein [Propionibacteriaceae bacterium]